MAGTPHGRHSIIINTGLRATNSQVLFTSLFKGLEALDTLGVVNRIALYFGDLGTGTNYYDEANAFTENAFAVYEFPPAGTRTWSWYFLIQFGETSPYGGSGSGAPASLNNQTTSAYLFHTGFAAAAAFTSGGASANPWTEAGGTTNNDGTDAKADPVWAAPALGNLYVLPRSNAVGGTRATSREDQSPVMNINASPNTRMHMLADDDNIGFFGDTDDNGSYWMLGCGVYVPLTGLTVEAPLWLLQGSSGWAEDTTYGTSVGGVVAPLDSSVRDTLWRIRPSERDTNYQPNSQFSTPEYMESPIPLYVEEGALGLVGFIDADFARHTYNVPTNATIDSLARVVIGQATQATDHFTFGWDGATADPSAASTRDGTDF